MLLDTFKERKKDFEALYLGWIRWQGVNESQNWDRSHSGHMKII